jgi:serine/threonine-protein kinase ULK/ATG1
MLIDIKPSNILLHNGIIKLANFGFYKRLDNERDLSKGMYSCPLYTAPEILKGDIYTMKATIWSLSAIFYQMLYGCSPFEEKSIARLIYSTDDTTTIFPSNINISKKTENMMKKMLVKDHINRIGW